MRKTIITASNQRLALGEILLQNNEVLTGVHILPFSAFFYKFCNGLSAYGTEHIFFGEKDDRK